MFWHCADIVIIPAPMTQFTLADADKPRLERVFELNALDDALDAYIIARIVREWAQENGTTVKDFDFAKIFVGAQIYNCLIVYLNKTEF